MATPEERMRILKLVEEGKITAEEGAKLLSALRETHKEAPRAVISGGRGGKGWLRVRVTDMRTGKTKVNVNLPMSLMDAGMKIGAQFAPELNGINLADFMDEIKSGSAGKIIDVMDEEDGEHVEIFVE